jgi:hypothetical protein
VPLIVASGGLAAGLKGTVQTTAVENTQVAVTVMEALGLDPSKLQGAVAEGTQELPTGPGGLTNTAAVTATQKYVNQVYANLLHREADPTSLSGWTAALDNKVLTPLQFVTAVENSPEFRLVEVNDAYQKFLHRSADPNGLSAFSALLASGGTVEQVDAALVSSPEYFTNAGGSNAGFLDALYRDALNRAIDAATQTAFLQALTAGTLTRGQVAAAVFTSDEYRTVLVQNDYKYQLGRAADTAGLNGYVALLKQGVRSETLLLYFDSSAEFLALTAKGT